MLTRKKNSPHIWMAQCNKGLFLTRISTHCGSEGAGSSGVIHPMQSFEKPHPGFMLPHLPLAFFFFSVFSQGKKVRIVWKFFTGQIFRGPTSILVIFHWPELPTGRPHLRDAGNSPVVCQLKCGYEVYSLRHSWELQVSATDISET